LDKEIQERRSKAMSNPIQGLGQAGAEFATKGFSGGAPTGGKAEFVDSLRNAMDQIGSLQGELTTKSLNCSAGMGKTFTRR